MGSMKASGKALKPHEIEALARQQNRMNNPNQTNIFGTTQTTFGDDDQASIVQTLSEPMQGIINSQMDFVSQGPAQLGQYSNPFIEGLMQNAVGDIARTSGWGNQPQSSMMGGFQGSSPQFNPQQQEAAQALGADPNQQINLFQDTMALVPNEQAIDRTPQAANKPMALEALKQGLQQAGQSQALQPVDTGRVNRVNTDASQLGNGLMAFLQKSKGV